MKITSIQIHSRATNNNSNKQINFKSAHFEDFNPKYSSITQLLEKETENFILTGNNVTKLGEGIGGETYKFISPRLSNIAIKKNKTRLQRRLF